MTPAIQTLAGLITGTGLLEVSGVGAKLIISGTNTFAGSVVVTNGGLLKVANGSGSATGTGSVNVINGGTLGGTGIIAGFATNNAGGNLIPGIGVASAGTVLSISNLTMLAGSTNSFVVSHNLHLNDKIVSQTVNYGGTLNVTTNAGDGALVAGDSFQLFSAVAYGLSNFGPINLPALSPGLTWNTSNLAFNGTISVSNAPAGPPTIGGAKLLPAGGGLAMSGSGGTPLAQYRILTATNVATPLANWTTAFTGTFDVNGNYSYTNTVLTNRASYFRLVTP